MEKAGEMPGSRGDSAQGARGEHAGEGSAKRGSPGPGCFLWNDTWQLALLPAWLAGITNQCFNQGDEHSVR